jgi:hypothetical protein
LTQVNLSFGQIVAVRRRHVDVFPLDGHVTIKIVPDTQPETAPLLRYKALPGLRVRVHVRERLRGPWSSNCRR